MNRSPTNELPRVEFCSTCSFDEAMRYRTVRGVYVWEHAL